MSTLALMRFLESAPSRYDRGMRWLTRGRVDAMREAIADEVRPRRPLTRALFATLRAPQAVITWIAVGSVSRPIARLEDEIVAAGFGIQAERRWLGGHLALIVAGCAA
jgi:hypothetical protein